MSKLIVFEGVDGSGKTTVSKEFAALLGQPLHGFRWTREPGGTVLAEKIREFIFSNEMDGMMEAYMMFAARRHHWNNMILPYLNQGRYVVSDRFIGSTYVYQVKEKFLPERIFKDLIDHFLLSVPGSSDPEGKRPVDTQFVLDVDFESAKKRLADRTDLNRLDFKDEKSFELRRAAYKELVNPSVSVWAKKTVVIDTSRLPTEDVVQSVLQEWRNTR